MDNLKDITNVLLESFDKLAECNSCKELLNLEYPHDSVYCNKCNKALSKDDFTIKLG